MTRYLSAALLCSLIIAPPAVAQGPTPDALQARYDSAYFAWRAGEYPAALELMERIMTAPDGERLLEPVALLTGEFYRSRELAPDGRDPQWSRDGRYASYETPTGSKRTTTIVAAESDGMRPVATLQGHNLAFAPAGNRAAYIAVPDTPGLIAARKTLDRLSLEVSSSTLDDWRRARVEVARLEGENARVMVRDLTTGEERELPTPDAYPTDLAFAGDELYLLAVAKDGSEIGIYRLGGETPALLASGPTREADLTGIPGTNLLLSRQGDSLFVLYDAASGEARRIAGSDPAVSADGSTLVFVGSENGQNTISVLQLTGRSEPVTVTATDRPLANPALSADGARIVYQMMPREDWELFLIESDGTGEQRLTRGIQHDLFPRFAGSDRILGVKGEGRHRRSYLYDLATGERTRLFHNNTVRTVAPEYEWAVSPDATRVLIVAERDGDTISPERGVYVMNLTRTVTPAEVLERVRTMLAAERELRERGRATFEPIAERVRAAVADVTVSRIYDYEQDLFQFGSKYITQPGNAKAIEYLTATLRSFGYEPELQWFEPEPGVRTANVVATLPGTENPELVYVVSSHFDSVEDGPGSDDDTSGTSALLEAARVLANRPQAATIKFAFFTGEEAGLYGSREFVRRAVRDSVRIVGALNNDMIGFANDERLDNTIRYSNAGIRDLQHAAAFLFTDLITYDAKYYKYTDAHAYYEEYGDIVGGIGSYPILANPHYHQSHDVLETINHQLVAEVSKTTVASIMALASSPSRLADVQVARQSSDLVVTWTPAAEQGVTEYVVAYGPTRDPLQNRMTVTEPRAVISGASGDVMVAVRAVNGAGLAGWDWARARMP